MDSITVDLRITSRCNMSCNFCHGAPRGLSDPSFHEVADSIEKIRSAGVNRLVISGGEPLIRKDVAQILEAAYNAGFETYLSTNGLKLLSMYAQVAPYLTWIGLPLDGSTAEMNARMSRSPRLLENTLDILRFFKREPPSHRVKVGTVVSRINIGDILSIGQLLFESSDIIPVDVWRLYDFAPRGEGLVNRSAHQLTASQFKFATSSAQMRFGRDRVLPLSNEDHDNSYFFINPDLSIVTAEGEHFPYLGSLKELSSKQLKALLEKHFRVAERSRRNRQWVKSP